MADINTDQHSSHSDLLGELNVEEVSTKLRVDLFEDIEGNVESILLSELVSWRHLSVGTLDNNL